MGDGKSHKPAGHNDAKVGGSGGGGATGGAPQIGKTTLTFPNMIDRARTVATIDQKDPKGAVKPVLATSRTDFADETGSEGVSFQAPTIKMSADVHLVKDCIPDPATVDVGWVQVVESSQRIALYERDGKIMHREIASITESVRDVLNAKDALAGGTRFYNPGAERKISLSAERPDGKVEMADGPSHTFPMKAGGGTLAGMTGQDHFRTSLMAAAGGQMDPIRTFEWSVPWDCHVTIGADKKHKDQKVVSASDGKKLGINRNAPLDGSDAKDTTTNGLTAMAMFSSYDSEAYATDVLNTNQAKFFNDLQTAKNTDHDSYWNMVGALWKSNKGFKLTVNPDHEGDKDEQFDVQFVGDNTVSQSASARTTFRALGHMVYDPAKLPRPIEVKINGTTLATMSSLLEVKTGSGTINKKNPGMSSDSFKYSYTLKFE